MWRQGLSAILVAAFLLLSFVGQRTRNVPTGEAVAYAQSPNLIVDGSQRYQRIDGFGVNANPKNWRNGELAPALDSLVGTLGARIWRVDVFGTSTWESTNDNGDPFAFNWPYYNSLYETSPFQAVWSTLRHLNQKEVEIILSASGVVPDWMGGSVIAQDDEWVELISSLVYYARNAKGVQFKMLSPLNETDKGPPEGPRVGPRSMRV